MGVRARLVGGDRVARREGPRGRVKIDGRGDRAGAPGEQRDDQLEPTGGPLRVSEDALARGDRDVVGALAEPATESADLGVVVGLGAGRVGVDRVDVTRVETGGPQGRGDHGRGAAPLGFGRGRVVAVRGETVAEQRLGPVGSRGAALEHDEAGALAERGPELRAEWTARAGRDQAEHTKAGDHTRRQDVGAADDERVEVAREQEVAGEGEARGGAGTRDRHDDPRTTNAACGGDPIGERVERLGPVLEVGAHAQTNPRRWSACMQPRVGQRLAHRGDAPLDAQPLRHAVGAAAHHALGRAGGPPEPSRLDALTALGIDPRGRGTQGGAASEQALLQRGDAGTGGGHRPEAGDVQRASQGPLRRSARSRRPRRRRTVQRPRPRR